MRESTKFDIHSFPASKVGSPGLYRIFLFEAHCFMDRNFLSSSCKTDLISSMQPRSRYDRSKESASVCPRIDFVQLLRWRLASSISSPFIFLQLVFCCRVTNLGMPLKKKQLHPNCFNIVGTLQHAKPDEKKSEKGQHIIKGAVTKSMPIVESLNSK